jgi:L,D-peptidoglycan transpeptidase YkuD (ErfK/YbiS/YcfS/YnhG family)
MRWLLMSLLFFSSSFFLVRGARAQSCPTAAKELLSRSHQLVTVMATNWDTKKAQIILWERPTTTAPWQITSKPTQALIGRSGMAWGYPYAALAISSSGKLKREGDERSPAGVYAFGKRFGFLADSTPTYLQILPTTVCVDDPRSTHYNQIVDSSKVKKDWKTAEEMHKIDLYRSGLEITYPTDVKTRAGSCIFFHLASPQGNGTSGCTSVSEDAMKAIQASLKMDFKPVIALLPRAEFAKWATCFPGLPMAAGAGGEL